MITLRDVTGRKSGAVMWDKDCIAFMDWMAIGGIPGAGLVPFSEDLLRKAEKLTEQDLTKDELDNLVSGAGERSTGREVSISCIWRIGGTKVVTFEGWS